MGLHLIAFSLLNPADLLLALQVALGIGMVIFVHELGHFAVAKWCGVKCEKFYLGFDIGGWKLFKFQWGETEYGIGVLPLGGYVKMLGQEDNPSRMAEELERAKLQQAEGDAAGGQAPGFDPRSFLAKSVPQRMAIISAGVIMNVIFAFCLATYCYGALGVKQVPCTVGNVLPGEAAWRAGLRAGDKIVQIGEVKHPMFRDLQRDVNLGDNLESGVKFVVERPGTKEPLTFKVTPDRGPDRLAPMIGITGPRTRELSTPPVSPASPLARLPEGFEPGDEIVAVNGKQVETSLALEHELYLNPGAASITVNRKLNKDETKIFNIDIPAIPTRTLGLVMKFGKITAVQDGSPADQAGIQKGDRLLEIDGAPVEGEKPIDPAALPQQLAARAGETVSLVLDRGGKRIETEARLRTPLVDEPPLIENHPQTVPALGLAYAIENTVAAVEPDSPAAKQKIKPGDEIVQAELVPPADAKEEFELKREPETETLEFSDEKHNYPAMFYSLQGSLPGTTVKLTLKGDRKVTLEPQENAEWLNPERGFILRQEFVTQKAESLGEALSLGAAETRDSLSLVFRFLRKITTGQVSIKGVGGPIAIVGQAGASASAGASQFLMFLAMLSANLAVINFLPIPLLDGGHMMFLAWEGVRGKPASEQVMTALQFAGLFFLAGLMLFVVLLDLHIIPRT